MAHNLFDERFFSYRKPAWHRLGYVMEEEHTAVEAGKLVGLPTVTRAPIFAEVNGILMPIRHKVSLWGHAVVDGESITSYYNVVDARYQELSHDWFCQMIDECTDSYRIETLGLLGDGSRMFLTLPLESFDVKGDELREYLLLLNALDGRTSVQGRLTDIRAVCENTLMAALAGRTASEYIVPHISEADVGELFKRWIRRVWCERTGMTQILREAYEGMANMTVNDEVAQDVISDVYTVPDMPTLVHKIEEWEHEKAMMEYHQANTFMLFQDSPTRTEGTTGNAWGIYNAVVEYEDHARHTPAQSRMFGAGARRTQKAFDVCMQLVGA